MICDSVAMVMLLEEPHSVAQVLAGYGILLLEL